MRARARTAGATARAVAAAGSVLRVVASDTLEVDSSGRPVPGAISLITVRGSALKRQEILAEIRSRPDVEDVVPNLVVKSTSVPSNVDMGSFGAAGTGARLCACKQRELGVWADRILWKLLSSCLHCVHYCFGKCQLASIKFHSSQSPRFSQTPAGDRVPADAADGPSAPPSTPPAPKKKPRAAATRLQQSPTKRRLLHMNCGAIDKTQCIVGSRAPCCSMDTNT